MIRAYIGEKGSGKTLSMIIDAVPIIRAGIRVCTNTPIDEDMLQKYFKIKNANIVFREGEAFINEFNQSENTLFIIDEGGVVFSKYNWKQFPAETSYRILTQRKFGNFIFVGTPRFGDFAIQLRDYVEEAVSCEKIKKLMYLNMYFNPIYFYKDKEDVDIKWQKKYLKKRRFIMHFKASKYYHIYNTKYVPDPSFLSGFTIPQPTEKADFSIIGKHLGKS